MGTKHYVMAPMEHNADTGSIPDNRVELFFELIRERQRLEDIYYLTGDEKMQAMIEEAREQIRESLMEMGITLLLILAPIQ